jgi:PKD domain.
MLRRQTIFKALSLTLSLLTFVACDKTNGLEVKTAEFSMIQESRYLTKDVSFVAKDSIGGNEYLWDFGDGKTLTGKYKVTHKYEKGGIFMTSLTINGITRYEAIKVNNGTLSFRIVNKSSKYFDCLTYLDNYESGSVTRFLVNPKSESDTIYGGLPNTYLGSSHLFGISLFIENSEYTLADILWIEDFKHHDIIVTDTTKVSPRSSHGNLNSVMIKDL